MDTLIVDKKRDLLKAGKKKGAPAVNFSDFDAIRLSVASPDEIRAWSTAKCVNPKPSITVLSSRSGTAFSASEFSVRSGIGSVPAVNINTLNTKGRFVIVAAWK